MKLNKHGFSLIEAMITVAILSIIGLGAASIITNLTKSLKDTRTLANRDYVSELIKHFAGNPRAIEQSRLLQAGGVNDPFRRCLDGGGAGSCPNAITEFSLYAPGGIKIAGTVASPVRYTPEGAVCPGPASAACPLEAITWYTPYCAGPCGATIALSLDINFMVKKSTAVTIPGLAYKSACSSGAAGCTSTTPPISIAIPLNNPTSVALNKLGYWSSTTGYTPSTAEQIPGSNNILLNKTSSASNSVNCDNTNAGSIRTNNGALQVCDGVTSTWKTTAGPIDSSTTTSGLGYPSLKNLYLCPGGGDPMTCRGDALAPCAGQVSKINRCCMGRAGQFWGAYVIAAPGDITSPFCTPLY